VSSTATSTREHVIYTSLDRSIQLHVVHPDVIDPLTSLGDPVVSPLTHVLLHYQSIHLFFLSLTLTTLYFYASTPISAAEALCFRVVRPCMRLYVRPCVRACILLARYLANQWTEFHQTLVVDVVEGRNKLIRF